MKLRQQITLRFVVVVMAILSITMLSVYVFTSYFLNKNFYRRLNNRAETVVGWLSQTIESRKDIAFLESLLKNRKDQITAEEIIVYDDNNRVVFVSNAAQVKEIEPKILAEIKQKASIEFVENDLVGVGILYERAFKQYIVIAMAKNQYADEFLQQMRWMMFGLLTFSIIFVGFIGWFYAKKTLEPIERIGTELNNIFPQNLNKRLELNQNKDEINNLTLTINQLLDRVEEGLGLQKMFIGNVSHELQNPLTRISSQLEVSLLKERTATEYQTTIFSALEDITDLVKLTQNLLKLSRMTAYNNELLAETVRLDELLFEAKNFVLNNNPNYKIELTFDALPEEPEHLCIVGNSSLLKIAFVNLVQNACKFSSDNQALINLSATDSFKVIHIEDKGIGIEPKEIEYIFQPFYRSSKTSETKGYGIGLSLVDRIIKMHNGKIKVASELGIGTKFSVIF
ncbi:two-component sensor histidine kinase [Emticicia aquatilis]|uniref:histidine kinase n=1 Tax=Emticicia aquatilis TaxID=1537369 RepID=A0A916YRY0_9BACT|nr:HAMP domain-containing sensor histidine kinase [Emticicia aquatilis]GGD58684.1 two-component sensor histidine kinase [Emticicia aquatilis]